MNLTDKKILAEWMGKRVIPKDGTNIGHLDWGISEGPNEWLSLHYWNPDTNHDQFKEVYNKLNWKQKEAVWDNLDLDLIGATRDHDIADLILNNLLKVISAVLTVIKEQVPA